MSDQESSLTPSSSEKPSRKKLTDEEKREILRKRRAEKIKGNEESRMQKLMYGDSSTYAPSSSSPTETKSENPVVNNNNNNNISSIEAGTQPSVIPQPALNTDIQERNNDKENVQKSPTFKLHDPKTIHHETKEFTQPIDFSNLIPVIQPNQDESTRGDLHLNTIQVNQSIFSRTRPSILQRIRPWLVVLISVFCALSFIINNEGVTLSTNSNANIQKVVEQVFAFSNKITPLAMILTFEIALLLPSLLFGHSVFSMSTDTPLDTFLYAKSVWAFLNTLVSDVILFIFVYIVSLSIHNIYKNYEHSQNMFSTIMEPFTDVPTVLWNQFGQIFSK
ncbi:hypothetical protein FDP41_011006 [Naegleria fowleri]|uniref:Uncharacterized protein n=1 Tax=Naegleria fowleri TaxID=5763 RepID=A0A6A5CBR6_NAEFO|nr:uncharacterized protein FDP41_011006 [Naegleria fowleri]KAF0983028.1 hypothetical protein FDP41_011006 [Naegleria fowleri]CAG4708405.1 unnamed protein product [Naegleria fowleri]